MKAEYKIRRGTYRVERSFVGTKQASELIRERVIRASRKANTGTASDISAYRQEKKEKIS